MNRVMISSIVSFVNMAIQNPKLLEVSPLAPLSPVVEKYKTQLKSGGCKCNKNAVLRDYKPVFEGGMASLSDLDKQQLKSALKADEVCYYVSGNGVLKMNCF